MEEKLLLSIIQLIEPLVDSSFRDESIGDILEMHHDMENKGVRLFRRIIVTLYRLSSLISGSFRVKLVDIFRLRQAKRKISNNRFLRFDTSWILFLTLWIATASNFHSAPLVEFPSQESHILNP